MRRLYPVVFALFLFLVPGLAAAAEPLSGNEVESFIALAPEMEKLGEEQAEECVNEDLLTLDPEEFVAGLEAAGLAGEFKALTDRHGFASPTLAVDVTRRIIAVYVVVESGGDPRDQLKEIRAQIEADTSLSAEERAEALATMSSAETMFANVEGDRPVVEPYLPQLKPIFDMMNGEME
jgi:hypothetical protein